MNDQKIRNWLKEHEIELEQSFSEALRDYAVLYKKISIVH